MASIFVSHSQKDTEIRDFFGTIFATTKLKAVFKEIEGFSSVNQSYEIERNIQNSKAVFVLLGKNVQKLAYTKSWVNWESGVAAASDKEIWVFEPKFSKFDVVIPKVNHFMIYRMDEEHRNYIRKIINYYDKSDYLAPTIAGTGIGGLTGTLIEAINPKKKIFTGIGTIIGALIGGVSGLIWADTTHNQPSGVRITCPQCNSSYSIHMSLKEIRCPICNKHLKINWGSK